MTTDAAALAAQRRIDRSRRDGLEVGEIVYTRDAKPVRVQQLSSIPGRFLAMPVKYSERYGIVRSGQSYWTEI